MSYKMRIQGIITAAIFVALPQILFAQAVGDLPCNERDYTYCDLPHAGANCSNDMCNGLVSSETDNCTVEATIQDNNLVSCRVCAAEDVSSENCAIRNGSVHQGT